MDYLAFRYTQAKYKVPIDYSVTEKHGVDTKVVKERLSGYEGASFLSGGLDSSLIAALNDVYTCYTASFPGFKYDEVKWAKKVADHLRVELKVVEITRERYLSTLEYLIRTKGDGLHPNEPCLYLCAKQAKEDGYDTILSGEGADDLFGGYTDLLKNEKKYMKDRETFLKRYCYINTNPDVPFETWKEWGMYRFILEVHTPGLIDRARNACKAAGIEVLFPYINKGLPQMMWEAPEHQRFGKGVLRNLAKEYLPKEIIEREKIGFPTPWNVKDFLRLNKEIGW